MKKLARTLAATAGAAAVSTLAIGAATLTTTAQATPGATAATHSNSTSNIHRDYYYVHRVSKDDPFTTAQCQAQFQINCYDPAQVQQAYNLTSLYNKGLNGRGRTIALVDVFQSPTIRDDLTTFDNNLSLQAPPSFKIIHPVGNIPGYDQSDPDMLGWAGEITLDVEYAHAAAPGANILLVEVPNENPMKIMQAEKYVIDHHLADVISQSFGWTEQLLGKSLINTLHGTFSDAAKHHITVLASSGDTGAANASPDGIDFYTFPTVSWPASDSLVTAVGGTQLNLNAAGNRAGRDTVWNDTYNQAVNNLLYGSDGPNPTATGGGKSVYFGRPSYQNGVKKITGNRRGIPDISMSGSCAASVNVYQSFGGVQAGWYPVCGTSESSPLFAGVVALAVQKAGHDLGAINGALYKLSSERAGGLAAVTQGNNTVSFNQNNKNFTVHGYYARNGYSMVAGVGSINAASFVAELARLG
jgi:subtilase family serine protease